MIKNIFVDSYETATTDIFFLRENGITRILSAINLPLKEKLERFHERFRRDFYIVSHRFYFDDTEAINMHDAPNEFHIRQIINLIKVWIADEKEHNVLIHCWAGISRSTAIAFIAKRLTGATNQEALDWLMAHRPQAHPNILILEYADAILGKLNDEERMSDFIYKWREERRKRIEQIDQKLLDSFVV